MKNCWCTLESFLILAESQPGMFHANDLFARAGEIVVISCPPLEPAKLFMSW
jgi:hypothetical protein